MTLNQKGFTIIELLVATSVFSVVLIMCTIAMLQIGRTYYKGITASRTQETAREIIDEVAGAVQYGLGQPEALTGVAGNLGYCIGGNKRYSYRVDRQVIDAPNAALNQSRHALVVDEGPCAGALAQTVAPSPPANPTGRELIATRMRLAVFRICFPGVVTAVCPSPPPAGSGLYQITVRIVSGDNDLLSADHMNCDQQKGGQFCAVSELSTVVQKRVN